MRNLVVSLVLLGLLGFLLFDIYKKKTNPVNWSSIVSVVVPTTWIVVIEPVSSISSSLSSSSVSSEPIVVVVSSSSQEISSSSSLTQAEYITLYNKFQSVANLPASSVVENWTTLQWLWTTLNPSTKIFVTNDRNYAYIVTTSWTITKKILAPGEKQFTRFWVDWNVLSLAQLVNNNSTTQITINEYNINNWDLIQSNTFNVSPEDVAAITKD